jgi:hypothetical protein
LTDRASTGGKANLTTNQLLELISSEELKRDLTPQIADMQAKVALCRDWRNRRLVW